MRTVWISIALLALGQGYAQSKPAARQPTPAAQTQAKPAAAKAAPATRQAPSKDEQLLFDGANRERQARGLAPFKWSAALASAARTHAQKMAQAGTLSHQLPGEMDLGYRERLAGVHFTDAAENVARGPSAAVIQNEWMNSPEHRDNLLDRDLDSLGIAVVERNGELFAVQDFSR